MRRSFAFLAAGLLVGALALPASAVISAVVVIYLYNTDAGPLAYWWYALPAAAVALYALLVSSMTR